MTISDTLHLESLIKKTETFISNDYLSNLAISHEQMESLIDLENWWWIFCECLFADSMNDEFRTAQLCSNEDKLFNVILSRFDRERETEREVETEVECGCAYVCVCVYLMQHPNSALHQTGFWYFTDKWWVMTSPERWLVPFYCKTELQDPSEILLLFCVAAYHWCQMEVFQSE